MDKLKKFLIIPVLYHVAIFVAMICFAATKDANLNIVGAVVADFAGCVIWAVFFAVMSIIHAILHEGKVYDYLYYCLGFIAIIAAVRAVVYRVTMGSTLLLVALTAGAVMFGIFIVWDCLFALTDHMMKKRPANKRRK